MWQTDQQAGRQTDKQTDRQIAVHTLTEVKLFMKAVRGRETKTQICRQADSRRQACRQIAVHTLTEVKLSKKAARGSPAAARLMALCPCKPASSVCVQMPEA